MDANNVDFKFLTETLSAVCKCLYYEEGNAFNAFVRPVRCTVWGETVNITLFAKTTYRVPLIYNDIKPKRSKSSHLRKWNKLMLGIFA